MAQNASAVPNNDEVRQKIALRAYEIYEDRGGQHGRDLDDWLRAEDEVLAEAAEKQALYGRKQPSKTETPGTPARSGRTTKPTASAG